eukprot:TRINITY_DN916_c0_g1_i5.p1 TRINITY_DN916_c0_g1~~TRINITY_DN916_c0_g1_i5.p1  ORF type:complete len:331 (-),score=69.69 TRINITY_DN916_c0_g1_i5:1188-2180(-)
MSGAQLLRELPVALLVDLESREEGAEVPQRAGGPLLQRAVLMLMGVCSLSRQVSGQAATAISLQEAGAEGVTVCAAVQLVSRAVLFVLLVRHQAWLLPWHVSRVASAAVATMRLLVGSVEKVIRANSAAASKRKKRIDTFLEEALAQFTGPFSIGLLLHSMNSQAVLFLDVDASPKPQIESALLMLQSTQHVSDSRRSLWPIGCCLVAPYCIVHSTCPPGVTKAVFHACVVGGSNARKPESPEFVAQRDIFMKSPISEPSTKKTRRVLSFVAQQEFTLCMLLLPSAATISSRFAREDSLTQQPPPQLRGSVLCAGDARDVGAAVGWWSAA